MSEAQSVSKERHDLQNIEAKTAGNEALAASKPHSRDELLARAAREPLGVDISDFSDEWCAGFLKGQVNALEESGLLEQYEALAKVILEADERTQQPIDLNYIAIFKDDWHRIVGKVTPPAKLADLFVSNPAKEPE